VGHTRSRGEPLGHGVGERGGDGRCQGVVALGDPRGQHILADLATLARQGVAELLVGPVHDHVVQRSRCTPDSEGAVHQAVGLVHRVPQRDDRLLGLAERDRALDRGDDEQREPGCALGVEAGVREYLGEVRLPRLQYLGRNVAQRLVVGGRHREDRAPREELAVLEQRAPLVAQGVQRGDRTALAADVTV